MRICPGCGRRMGDDAAFCPFDGTPLAPGRPFARDPLLGTTIAGRYRITNRLGSGGYSVVYVAQHLALGIDVALKVLHESFVASERAVARFAREARTASRIDHENVVKVFDFGFAEQGFHYLVMELVGGSPLDAEIAHTAPMPAPRVLHVLGQIAAGVGRAHELGIIHRDLKPENVALTQRGNDRDFVKVLDFGLARIVQPERGMPALTRAGDVFGTPAYMAPEQWRAEPADARTDIYALGGIAYAMLTGTVPFDSDAIADVMTLHLETKPARPRERAPDAGIPESLERVVMRCLEKSPEERFQGVPELLAALRAVALSLPGSTRFARQTGNALGARMPAAAMPDPTVYQASRLEMVWDGPALCEEIQRLHELRARRLAELAPLLWREGPPREFQEVQRAIQVLEDRVETHGREVALARAALDELDQAARQQEAELRLEMISASLDLQASQAQLPFEVTVLAQLPPRRASDDGTPTLIRHVDRIRGGVDPHGFDDEPSTAVDDQAHEDVEEDTVPRRGLRSAERRLASYQRRLLRERMQQQSSLGTAITQLREAERQLAPLYERLASLLPRAALRNPDLRGPLVAFGQLDGVLATYQALLEAMGDAG